MIIYRYTTKAGPFTLVPGNSGWMAYFEDDCFDGPFPSAQAAAEDVANGHTAWPSCGDPSRLGIPDDLSQWERGRAGWRPERRGKSAAMNVMASQVALLRVSKKRCVSPSSVFSENLNARPFIVPAPQAGTAGNQARPCGPSSREGKRLAARSPSRSPGVANRSARASFTHSARSSSSASAGS